MSKQDKRVERLRRLPPEMDYDEVAAVLELLGWTWRNKVGSHNHWTKPDQRTMTVVERHGRVKRAALRDIVKQLDAGAEE